MSEDINRENYKLLRECRLAVEDLINKKPGIEALSCGNNTIGNLKVEIGAIIEDNQ